MFILAKRKLLRNHVCNFCICKYNIIIYLGIRYRYFEKSVFKTIIPLYCSNIPHVKNDGAFYYRKNIPLRNRTQSIKRINRHKPFYE